MSYKYHFYLAGPFFTPQQVARMDEIKGFLTRRDFSVADPRELGPVIVDTPLEQRTPEMFKAIFDGNISAMDQSFAIIANVDEKDIGTAFELGYFFKKRAQTGCLVFTICLDEGSKTNVMLSQAVDRHFRSLIELKAYLLTSSHQIKNFRQQEIRRYLSIYFEEKATADE